MISHGCGIQPQSMTLFAAWLNLITEERPWSLRCMRNIARCPLAGANDSNDRPQLGRELTVMVIDRPGSVKGCNLRLGINGLSICSASRFDYDP